MTTTETQSYETKGALLSLAASVLTATPDVSGSQTFKQKMANDSGPIEPAQERDLINAKSLVAPGAEKGGEGGKGGEATPSTSFTPTNAAFIDAIFTDLPESAQPIITAKVGDPQVGVWIAKSAAEVGVICTAERNTYVNCASFRLGDDGSLAARKDQAVAYHALVLDDVGTKIDRALLGDIRPTWELETSPGNFQIGFKLNRPLQDAKEVEELQRRIAAAGLTDKGALGMVRWVRLPVGINGKPGYRKDGKPFSCRLHAWHPEVTYAASDLADVLAPKATAAEQPVRVASKVTSRKASGSRVDGSVFRPRASENPVLAAFKEKGLYKREITPGKHEVTCPWLDEHTDQLDTGAAYFEPDAEHPNGGFCCQHSHKDQYHIGQVLEHFDLSGSQARNKPLIRTVQGEMKGIFDAAVGVLAQQGDLYHAGGVIVKATYDQMIGDWRAAPLSESELTLLLAVACDWERFDKRSGSWERCDPPQRHVNMIYKAQSFDCLPLLKGLARQPYYREDGQLVVTPGYDPVSQRLSVFDATKFPEVAKTEAAAQQSLAELRELLSEFRFADPVDEAAALSAILTAATRPALELAPAFHVKAPSSGSGKSYLCEVISLFAGPGSPARMSYPKTTEEATKSIIAALLTAPAVIEFDDMDTDWLPHGAINRMLTSRTITDRVLGFSKTATVSTTALILGSGNNVGPISDLARRVVTINLNTRSATPGTIEYKGNPAAALRAKRERYVMAALSIIEAWRAAGSPKQSLPSIASYGGKWNDYCRQALVWLGLPDPASSLIAQMQHDPDLEQLEVLLTEWHARFGDKPVTLRRLVDDFNAENLQEALMDLPVVERGSINRSKLGWYFKRKMHRIVAGLMLVKAESGERNAWKVVKAGDDTPPLPSSPPLQAPSPALSLADPTTAASLKLAA